MKTLPTDKVADQTKPATVVRMGREVPINKPAPKPESEKDRKERLAENAASALV
jgi:hypothetical protein